MAKARTTAVSRPKPAAKKTAAPAPARKTAPEPVAKTAVAEAPAPPKKIRPSATQLAHLAADIVLEKKGQDLVVIDLSRCSDLTDYMVIASGSNRRQVQAMAEEIRVRMKKAGAQPQSISGFENGWWVLLDLGSVVVHLMQPDARTYYDLEALWADGAVVRRGVEA